MTCEKEIVNLPENLVNTGIADTRSKMWKRWILWIPKDGVSRKPYISADHHQNPTENYPQENNKISTGKTGIIPGVSCG